MSFQLSCGSSRRGWLRLALRLRRRAQRSVNNHRTSVEFDLRGASRASAAAQPARQLARPARRRALRHAACGPTRQPTSSPPPRASSPRSSASRSIAASIKSVRGADRHLVPRAAPGRRPPQASDHRRGSADDAVGAGVDERPQLWRLGAQRQLGALRAGAADGERAGHARWSTAPAARTCSRRSSRKATGTSTWQFAQDALASRSVSAGPLAPGSAGHLFRRQRDAPDTEADGGDWRALSQARRVNGRQIVPASWVDHIVRAAHHLSVGLGAAVRIRLVDPGLRRWHGLLRAGAMAGNTSSSSAISISSSPPRRRRRSSEERRGHRRRLLDFIDERVLRPAAERRRVEALVHVDTLGSVETLG